MRWVGGRRTTERFETESLDLCGCSLKVGGAVVVLDQMDDVEDGEHSSERGGLGVP